MAQVTIGDIWDSLDQAKIAPVGAALGHAYVVHNNATLRIANRGFIDARVAPTSVLNMVKSWGLAPLASEKYQRTYVGDWEDPIFGSTSPLLMADTADPGTTAVTGVQAVAGYLGGWTPHVWTLTQWKTQTVPVQVGWTYNPNKPGATQGTLDGQAASAKAKSLGVTPGTAISIDMETSQDQPYCLAFRNAVNTIAAGSYWVRIYGSASTVFGNWATPDGPGGGWHVAQWTGIPHMFSDGVHTNIWSTQYADAAMVNLPWDMNEIVDLSHLWYPNQTKYTLTVTAKGTTGSTSKTATFLVNS